MLIRYDLGALDSTLNHYDLLEWHVVRKLFNVRG